MATESVTDQTKTCGDERIYEQMQCQLMAELRKRWPEDYGTRPKLTLIQGGRASCAN